MREREDSTRASLHTSWRSPVTLQMACCSHLHFSVVKGILSLESAFPWTPCRTAEILYNQSGPRSFEFFLTTLCFTADIFVSLSSGHPPARATLHAQFPSFSPNMSPWSHCFSWLSPKPFKHPVCSQTLAKTPQTVATKQPLKAFPLIGSGSPLVCFLQG